jgi:L-histidine N-alpha-methyltransferase
MESDAVPRLGVQERFSLIDAVAGESDPSLAAEVMSGLSSAVRSLPCRFFYDDVGSVLFEEICTLPEYYLTRCERRILERHAADFCSFFPGEIKLVELGSGSAVKTRLIIDALLARQKGLHFVPIDIARHALEESAATLLADYSRLFVDAIAGEYTSALDRLSLPHDEAHLILWLGSSIGNLDRLEAIRFLERIVTTMSRQDRMLIGIDLRKDRARLEQAYDDARGVTARFNKNLLSRINRELGADFELEQFEFRVCYDEESGSVESRLVSLVDQEVFVRELDTSFRFSQDEPIHTEDSHKYSFEEIDELARSSGMRCEERWLDPEGLFSVNLFAPL